MSCIKNDPKGQSFRVILFVATISTHKYTAENNTQYAMDTAGWLRRDR